MGFLDGAINKLEKQKMLNPADSTIINAKIKAIEARSDSIKTAQQAAKDNTPLWEKVGDGVHSLLDEFNDKVNKTINIWTGE